MGRICGISVGLLPCVIEMCESCSLSGVAIIIIIVFLTTAEHSGALTRTMAKSRDSGTELLGSTLAASYQLGEGGIGLSPLPGIAQAVNGGLD